MSNEKFDVKLSFTNISFATLTAIFANILKENPTLLVGVETEAGNLNLHATDDATVTGAAGKVVPLDPETSPKKSGKSETKSGSKASKSGASKAKIEEVDGNDDDEEEEKEEKPAKKSKKTSSEAGTKPSKKSASKKAEPEPEDDEDEDDEDEDEESKLPKPVQTPEKYDKAALKQLIADTNDNGVDVLDETLEYFEIKSIKELEDNEIKAFYKKLYKNYKAAAESDEDGE